jgi:hypothetical protein
VSADSSPPVQAIAAAAAVWNKASVAYRLDPHVAGELGEATELDPSTHPPIVRALEYVLDAPDADDLIESFPVFLVSASLAGALENADLTGFALRHLVWMPGSIVTTGFASATA